MSCLLYRTGDFFFMSFKGVILVDFSCFLPPLSPFFVFLSSFFFTLTYSHI